MWIARVGRLVQRMHYQFLCVVSNDNSFLDVINIVRLPVCSQG